MSSSTSTVLESPEKEIASTWSELQDICLDISFETNSQLENKKYEDVLTRQLNKLVIHNELDENNWLITETQRNGSKKRAIN